MSYSPKAVMSYSPLDPFPIRNGSKFYLDNINARKKMIRAGGIPAHNLMGGINGTIDFFIEELTSSKFTHLVVFDCDRLANRNLEAIIDEMLELDHKFAKWGALVSWLNDLIFMFFSSERDAVMIRLLAADRYCTLRS